MNEFHTPVLVRESADLLKIRPGVTVIDATAGFAGHMREFIRRGAWVLGIDADKEAVQRATQYLKQQNLTGYRLVWGNFRNIERIASENGVKEVDAVFFDLGVSSYQLDTGSRGFTYRQSDAPLDMRFDPSEGVSAAELINSLTSKELYEVILKYGEEKYSRAVSLAIDRARTLKPLKTAGDLKAAIEKELGQKRTEDALPRVFQALRILVNDEMGALHAGLTGARNLLKRGGRVGVISFHSLEDRTVKLFFRQPGWKAVTKKPLIPSREEQEKNKRSRSAKLRIAEKQN